MPYCTSCGERVADTAQFCTNCGAEMPGAGGDEPAEDAAGTAPAEAAPAGDEELLHDRHRGIDFAVYYPKHGGWQPVAISGLLVIGALLIVPALFLIGYTYRVGRAAALGRPTPPAYGDWGGLAVDGLRMTALWIVGALIWLVVAVVLLAGAVGVFGEGGLTTLVSLGVQLLSTVITGALLAAFFGSASVVDAVTDGRAITLVRSPFFLKAVLWAILLQIALGIFVGLLIFTIVGWIWGVAYAMIAQTAFWGYVHYRATAEGIVPPPVEDPAPAPEASGPDAGQPAP